MLTFKATLEDANAAFDKAAAAREATIEALLTLFKLDYGQSRKQRLTYAISKLDEANNHLVKAGDELLRLKHIEHVTDLIASPFPAHIAEQMRAAGIDEEAQREIANEILADETPAGEPLRESVETPDAPWLKADIGGGEIEYRPGTIEELYESDLRDVERSMSDAERGTIEAVIDMLLGDEPLSLHGDGHVGPVARHLRDCAARETSGFSLHDLLEAISEPGRS